MIVIGRLDSERVLCGIYSVRISYICPIDKILLRQSADLFEWVDESSNKDSDFLKDFMILRISRNFASDF